MSSQEWGEHVLLLLLLLVLMHSLLWLLVGSGHHPHIGVADLCHTSSIVLHAVRRRSKILLLLLGEALAGIELWDIGSVGATRQQIHEEVVGTLTYLQSTLLNRVELQMWSAQAHLLDWEVEVVSLQLRVVILHKLLNDLNVGIFEVLESSRYNFLNLLEVVHANILVTIGLEDLAGDFPPFEALGVNEVAVLATRASIGSMEVAAWHSSEVTGLDYLVHGCHGLLRCGRHLVELCHLCLTLLIYFLVLGDCFVC